MTLWGSVLFHVITGHAKGSEPLAIDFEALHERENLIFLMGVSNLRKIRRGLMAAGMSQDMQWRLLT